MTGLLVVKVLYLLVTSGKASLTFLFVSDILSNLMFRQILPFVKGGNRAEIVNCCLKRSCLWRLFEKFSLDENLRLLNCSSAVVKEYDAWLVKIGNGCAPSTTAAVLPADKSEIIDSEQRAVCIRRMIHWVFGADLSASCSSYLFLKFFHTMSSF